MTLSSFTCRLNCWTKLLHNGFALRKKSTWSSISEILKRDIVSNETLTVKGWVKSSRKMKGMIFVDVNDGSGPEKLQVVIRRDMKPDNLSFGASVVATGRLTINPNNQAELQADEFTLVGECDSTNGQYPFAAKKSYPEDYVRKYLHFRPRYSTFSSTLRLRDAAMRSLHDTLGQLGYICVNTPILTSNDCEGAGEVFNVVPHNKELVKSMKRGRVSDGASFFGCEAFLSVSGQLQLEAAARGLGKVYTFGPTFRAENSKSRLHLSEFYMLEAEIAFSEDIEDPMKLAETLVRKTAQKFNTSSQSDLDYLKKHAVGNLIEQLKQVAEGPQFPRLKYEEAVSVLEKHQTEFEVPITRGENLKKEHELFLSNYTLKHMNQSFLFVTHWPANIKPFYMKHDQSGQALAFDLLGPICGEVCGGSVREPDSTQIERQLLSQSDGQEVLKSLEWYLDIRRQGNVPTSGFGIGFERLIQSLIGIANIKDVLPFPRGPHNLKM